MHTGLTSGHGAGGQHLHGDHGHLHRQGRPGWHRPADRPRAGDPAAQDQAGGVLRLDRPHPGAATTGDRRRGRRRTPPTTEGGGKNIGFIEDGDYVSYKPVNLRTSRAMRFRVASAGAGGTIEVRLDSPTGTLVGTTATITPTGGWQTFKTVSLPLTNPPAGTHELFLVFRNRGSTRLADQRQLDRVRRQGRRDDRRAGRRRLGDAGHRHRAAERAVHVDGHRPGRPATDLSLRLGLRRARHDDGHLDAAEPELHVRQRGQLPRHADRDRQAGRHDDQEASRSRSRPAASCNTAFRDDFNGTALDPGWSVVRRDQALTVSGGAANIATENGDVYHDDQQRQEHRAAHRPVGRLDGDDQDQRGRQRPVPPGGPDRLRRRRQLHEVRPRGDERRRPRAHRELRVHQRGRGHARNAAPTRRRQPALHATRPTST